MNSTDLYRALSEPFSESAEKTIVKQGTSLTYIPQAEVVNRLNRVFGVDNWSMQVLYVGIPEAYPDAVIAHVRLTATTTEVGESVVTRTFSRDGVGGQPIKFRKPKPDDEGKRIPVDLGDEFKGAVSDALKKAAQLLGVAMYLARDEDALDEESAPAPHPRWEDFRNASSKLDEVAKTELGKAWAKRTNNGPKPTATSVTDDDMDFLFEQVVGLALGGKAIES